MDCRLKPDNDDEGNKVAAATLRPFSPISAFTRVFDALWGRRTG
jgi:hypothetical protein